MSGIVYIVRGFRGAQSLHPLELVLLRWLGAAEIDHLSPHDPRLVVVLGLAETSSLGFDASDSVAANLMFPNRMSLEPLVGDRYVDPWRVQQLAQKDVIDIRELQDTIIQVDRVTAAPSHELHQQVETFLKELQLLRQMDDPKAADVLYRKILDEHWGFDTFLTFKANLDSGLTDPL